MAFSLLYQQLTLQNQHSIKIKEIMKDNGELQKLGDVSAKSGNNDVFVWFFIEL